MLKAKHVAQGVSRAGTKAGKQIPLKSKGMLEIFETMWRI